MSATAISVRAVDGARKGIGKGLVHGLLVTAGLSLSGCGQHHVIANDRIAAEIKRQGAMQAAFRSSDFSEKHTFCTNMNSDEAGNFTCRSTMQVLFSSDSRGSTIVSTAIGTGKTMSYTLKFQIVGGMMCYMPQELSIIAGQADAEALKKFERSVHQTVFPDNQAFCDVLVGKDKQGFIWTFFESGLPVDTSSRPESAVHLVDKAPSAYVPGAES